MRIVAGVWVTIILAGCVSGAPQHDLVGRSKVIEIHHLDPAGARMNVRGSTETAELVPSIEDTAAPLVRLDHTEKPSFVITDPNPILFSYAAGALTSRETQTMQAASALSAALKTMAGLLPQNSGAAEAGKAADTCDTFRIQSIDVEEFFRTLATVLKQPDEVQGVIDTTLNQTSENLKLARQTVQDWNLAGRKKIILGGLDAVQEVRSRQLRGEKINFEVPERAGQCKLALTRAELDDSKNKIDVKYRSAFDAFVDLRSDAKEIRDTIASLELLSSRLDLVGIPQPLDSKVAYSGTTIQTQAIVITPVADFAAHLSTRAKDLQTKRSGTYKVSAEPYERVHLIPSVGVIYSFVKAPKFSATKDSSGKFVVTQTSNDYTELGASVAGNLVWDEFFGQPVEPYLQLGVSPDKDNLAFLFGAGVRVFERFTLGAGIAYQRIKQLSAGQSIGMVLESEDELKTESRYKSGLYLTFSYKLKE